MYSILYVDDEPGLLEIAKLFLEQDRNFSVETQLSAAAALDHIARTPFDAIISDYQMPGMDGIAFLKEVRQKHGDIPFILFTGRGREEVVIAAINNGADFYLQKGGDPTAQFAELAHKVRQAVARRRAELSLIESEKRLTDIINFLPDATFAIDRAGTVIAWNRAIEEMTGVPSVAMLGKGDYEYAIPFYGTRRKILIDLIFEPDEFIAKNYTHIIREKDVLIADTTLPRPKGRVLTLLGKASPLYNPRGEIVGAIESIRDITERERDAEQLAQKTRILSIINRIIQSANLQQTIKESIRTALTSALDLLHYDGGGVYLIDERTGTARVACSENLDPVFVSEVDNIDIRMPPYSTVFVKGEPVILENFETLLPHAAAISGLKSVASIPIVTHDKVIGALNVASRKRAVIGPEDREILVTIGRELGGAVSRMKAELALRESEEKFRAIFEKTHDALFLVSDGVFIDCNQFALDMFGYSSKDAVLGLNVADISPQFQPDGQESAAAALIHDRTVLSQGKDHFEWVHKKKDGSTFVADVLLSAFTLGGKKIIQSSIRDITERSRIENELFTSRQMLQAVLDTIPQRVFWKDRNSVFLGCNKNLALDAGYPDPADLVGKTDYDHASRSTADLYRADDRKVMDTGQARINYEEPQIRPDGSRAWLRTSKIPLRNKDGAIIGVLGTYEDITEQKRGQDELRAAYEQITASEEELRGQLEELAVSQQKLAESRQQLAEIASTMPGVIFQFYARPDGTMGLSYVSSRAAEIFGIAPEPETFLDRFTANVDPRDRDRLLDSIRTTLASGGLWEFEGRYTRPDGAEIWFQGIARLVEKGRDVIYNGVLLDITARKKAEEERSASEEQFRRLISYSFDAVIIHQGGRIVLANEHAARMMGAASPGDLAGKLLLGFVHPEFRDAVGERVRKMMQKTGDTSPLIEEKFLRLDGTTVDVEVMATTSRYEGREAVMVVFRDITDRKRSETELHAAYEQLTAAEEELRGQYEELAFSEQKTRESEEKFRAIFEKTHDALLLLSGDVCIDCNEGALDLFGYGSREEFIGLRPRDISPPLQPDGRDSASAAGDYIREAIRSGSTQFEWANRKRDGSTFIADILLSAFELNGKAIILSSIRDITERNRTERAIQAISIELNQIFRNMTNAFVVWESVFDAYGKYVSFRFGRFNDAYARISGLNYEEVRGKDVFTVWPETEQSWVDVYGEVAVTGTPKVFEMYHAPTRGWYHCNAYRPTDSLDQICVIFEDITERRRADEALRQANLVIENSPAVVFRWKAEEGWPVMYVSENVSQFGYTPEDLLSGAVPFSDLVHPDDLGRIAAEVERYTQDGTVRFRQEYRIVTRAGDVRWIEDHTVVERGADGRATHYQGIILDKTEQKRAEEALEKRIVALTRPLEDTGIAFEDLFDMDEIQRLQDEFAKATGVAVLLTRPDGKPITKPSNFTRLCGGIVRSTQRGLERCTKSDAELGGLHESLGPYIHTCLSAGLWGAGANIFIGDRHIANWLIGQVRNEAQTEEDMRKYAREIGVDEGEFIQAFLEVPVMSSEQFAAVAQSLYIMATQLSKSAYQNVQQARFITERKEAEEALRRSEERLRLFIQQAPVALAMFDTGMHYLAASRRWIADYHLEDREILGRSHYEVFPEISEDLKAIHRRGLAGEILSADEGKFVREDGSVQWLAWEVRPWYTARDTIGGIIIFSDDITKRKRAEEALREKTEELDQYFNASLDLFCIADTDGYFRRLNPEWERTLGYSLPELEGKRFLDFVHPDDMSSTVAATSDLAGQKKVLNFTNRFRHKDGTYRWIEWRSFPKGNLIFAAARDITERKRIDEALRESEVKYRSLIEGATEAITIIQDGRYVYVNPVIADLVGIPAGDLIGTPFLDIIWPDDQELLRTRYWQRYAGEDVPAKYDFRLTGPDGRPRWVHISIARILWQGRPATLNMMTDITERKLAESALQESEARLRSVLHGSPVLQFVIGLDHRILSWNRALEEYSGIPAGDVIGTDQQWRAFYPEKRPVLADLLVDKNTDGLFKYYGGKLQKSRYVEGAYEATDFFPMMGSSGTWLSFTAAPIRDAAGTMIGAVETLEDVTERVNAEKALRKSEEKYRRIIENMQDAYVRADENGILTMVSPSAARMYGYASANEMIGLNAGVLYARSGQREDMFRKLEEAGGITDFTGEALRKDGSTFWTSLNVQFVRDDEGRIRGTEGIVRDISERRSMERAIQEANKKLALLGSITRHDVANKVSVISGFAQAARMKNPDPDIVKFLDRIETAGADISRQIAFTKSYQELGMHAPGWRNIHNLVSRQKTEGVAVSCTCHAEVYADPMLEKVIGNLFDNAVRHGERVTKITVRCRQAHDHLVITVADNGVGIPGNHKEKIFERGFGKHTGFGLFLVREILAITGITIQETGKPGDGARFELMVPKGLYRIVSGK